MVTILSINHFPRQDIRTVLPVVIIVTTGVVKKDAREQLGLAIAAKCKTTRKDGAWLVPSQSQDGEKYTVIPGTKCSCPDHEVRQLKCKHLWAVEYVLARETAQDGTVTETEIVKVPRVTRKTYPQNWPAYNAAQSEEKTGFGVLLTDLCWKPSRSSGVAPTQGVTSSLSARGAEIDTVSN
jgi:hypothetical protein